MKKSIIVTLAVAFFLASIVSPALAQDLSNGTAIGVSMDQKNIKDGSIISATTTGYKLTTSPYDPQVFGVVTKRPAVYLSDSSDSDQLPVISVGQVQVRVTSLNGNIKPGDFITTSKYPGVGQRASSNGFVLGTATEGYSSNNPNKEGEISVTLHPHFAQLTNDITHNVFDAFNLGFSSALQSPSGLVRYFVAGTITLLSFFFGFRFFARASNRGVEAIGRNPLASRAILLSVFINTIITIVIMFFGVAISYLILVL